MKHKILVKIEKLGKDEYMARAELVKATAMGKTPEDAMNNLIESIEIMVEEFGSELVFRNMNKSIDYRLVEVGN